MKNLTSKAKVFLSVVLVLIIVAIICGLASCGNFEGTQATIPAASQETENKDPEIESQEEKKPEQKEDTESEAEPEKVRKPYEIQILNHPVSQNWLTIRSTKNVEFELVVKDGMLDEDGKLKQFGPQLGLMDLGRYIAKGFEPTSVQILKYWQDGNDCHYIVVVWFDSQLTESIELSIKENSLGCERGNTASNTLKFDKMEIPVYVAPKTPAVQKPVVSTPDEKTATEITDNSNKDSKSLEVSIKTTKTKYYDGEDITAHMYVRNLAKNQSFQSSDFLNKNFSYGSKGVKFVETEKDGTKVYKINFGPCYGNEYSKNCYINLKANSVKGTDGEYNYLVTSNAFRFVKEKNNGGGSGGNGGNGGNDGGNGGDDNKPTPPDNDKTPSGDLGHQDGNGNHQNDAIGKEEQNTQDSNANTDQDIRDHVNSYFGSNRSETGTPDSGDGPIGGEEITSGSSNSDSNDSGSNSTSDSGNSDSNDSSSNSTSDSSNSGSNDSGSNSTGTPSSDGSEPSGSEVL